MKNLIKNLIVILLVNISVFAFGQQSLTLEPAPPIIKSCLSCHGTGGNSQADVVPRISGLQADYIVTQLKAFKDGSRHDEDSYFMTQEVVKLTTQQISEIANYFSAQLRTPLWAGDPELIAKGKVLFENGIPAKDVMACNSCHGQQGEGSFGPQIMRQHGFYLMRQFDAFKIGTRQEATMMPSIVQNLDRESMRLIALYLESL